MKPPPGPRAVPLSEIAEAVGGRLIGSAETSIAGVSSLSEARPGELSFVEGDRFIPAALASRAAAFVVDRDITEIPRPQVIVTDPRYAFVRIVERFFVPPPPPPGIAAPGARGAAGLIGPPVCKSHLV